MGNERKNGPPLVEKAKLADAVQIHRIINLFAGRGEMLHRALPDIYENIRNYFVCRDGKGIVVGCVSLSIFWGGLGEIRSVAVQEDCQNRGNGSALVNACLNEAQELKLPAIFICTNKPEFFEQFDFKQVDSKTLPKKAWGECPRCIKYPDCGEATMIRNINLTPE